MKKYVALFGVTLMIIGGLLWYQKDASSITNVSAMRLTAVTAQGTVNCSGRIEESEKRELYTELPVVPSRVYVAEGDTVNKGALLMEISPSKTVEAMASYYTSMAGGDIQSVLSLLQNEALMNFLKENSMDLAGSKDQLMEKIPQKIYAPAAGVVSSLNVTKGVLSTPGQAVAVIASTDSMQLRLSVNEASIASVAIGQKVTITGSGFQELEYHGTVKSISSVAKQVANGTSLETAVEVIVAIDDADKNIKPGFSANAKILVEEIPNALIIPYDCVRGDDDASEYVYVWRDGQAIKIGIKAQKETETGFLVHAESGLRDGDIIFTNPELVAKSKNVTPVLQNGGEEHA